LLVLDNCEHLIEACAELVEELMRATQRMRVLCTSREPLGIEGETIFRVSPLQVPDPASTDAEKIGQYESVRLFVERARASVPDFVLSEHESVKVAVICRRLDGIPLAIELAASRVYALGVEQIVVGLDDRFRLLVRPRRTGTDRHQTLQRAIDWSYDLLSPIERAVFAQLTVFAGGCTLAAAEAVCGQSRLQEGELLQCIAQLADKSMIVAERSANGSMRYTLHETLRQYGRARLSKNDAEASTRVAHAEYFLGLAEEVEPHLKSNYPLEHDQAWWLDVLDREHDNLRTALEWSLETGETERAVRFGAALWRFWINRGHLAEGEHQLARLLPHAKSDTTPALTVLLGHAILAWNLNYRDVCRAELTEVCRRADEVRDWSILANALTQLGGNVAREGDPASGLAKVSRGLAIRREHGDRFGTAVSLDVLAQVAVNQRDLVTARRCHSEALALALEVGDETGAAQYHMGLGALDCEEGNLSQARIHYVEALQRYRELGNPRGLSRVLAAFGWLAIGLDQLERGFRLFGAGQVQAARGGFSYVATGTMATRRAAAVRKLGDDAANAAWKEGESWSLDQAVRYALDDNTS
jgi:non-specific serine/threonine protein kinase